MSTGGARAPEAGRERRGSLEVDGARIHYEERGAGASILCIHGTGSSALTWAPAAERLARLGRVITYDRRGFARSGPPDPAVPASVARHAADAAALLEARGAGPTVVVGRSYGGGVAIELALRHPGRVRALVLLEGAPESLDPEAARWLDDLVERTLAGAGDGPAAVADRLFRQVLGDEGWEGIPDEARQRMIDNGPGILWELRGEYVLRVDPGDLARIDAPALIVTAADSPPAFRRANERAAAAIPGARAVLVGGGHLVDPADPVVLDFVAEALG